MADNKIEGVAHLEQATTRDDEIEKAKNINLDVVDDDAKGYVDPTLVISPEEDKRLRWRIHTRVLPLMCLAYITQSLDKGTLGPSSIMGWLDHVNAKGQDYALTSTFLWCGIILGEPIAGQLVRRVPLAKLLGCSMIIWSALAMGLTFSLSIPPVFAIRFLLGFFESVFGPVLLSITVQWYLKSEQAFISSIWQSMLGFAACIMSLLAYGLYHIPDGKLGMHTWQWLTLTVSLMSFVSATLILLFLPDSPTKARWASEDDKVAFVERVRSNAQGIKHKEFKRYQAREALTDPFTYMLFFLALFNTLVVGGIGKFAALLINKTFGFSVLESQLLSIPLGLMGVATYMVHWIITKTNQALYTMIGLCVPNIVGTIVLIVVPSNDKTKPGLLVAFYFMQCFQACNPGIFLMLARNSAGQTKKSITYATTYMAWAGGNAIAPQLFQSKWAPRYIISLEVHLGLYGAFIIMCLAIRALLVRRNKKKVAAATNADGVEINTHSRAFEDLTDIENPEFRYSL